MFPVLVQFRELGLAFGRELVIFAGRAGVGFLPFIIEQPVAAHLAEERVEGSFLSGEVGLAQAAQDVGDVDLVRGDDLQNQELEQSLADRDEFLVDTHLFLLKLPCCNKVAVQSKGVNPFFG